MLDKINELLASLGCNERWKILPEFLPQYETLKGKTVVLLEDSLGVIRNIIPVMMVATDGNFHVLYDSREANPKELIAKLKKLAETADVILLDYELYNFEGPNIANALRVWGYRKIIVGFSSMGAFNEIFMDKSHEDKGCADFTIMKSNYSNEAVPIKLAEKLIENS